MTTLAYVATPYTKYKPGIEQAYIDACKLTARLISAGVNAYSPITHSHGIALHGNIDPLDQRFWNYVDAAILSKCDTLIVAHMDGWDQSSGVAHEIEVFEAAGKPIFDLDPDTLNMVRRTGGPAVCIYGAPPQRPRNRLRTSPLVTQAMRERGQLP